MLRLQFPDTRRDHDEVELVSWEQFFEEFDAENLAFVYQDDTESGRTSRFYEFVDRETVRNGG